ncbi:MAG: trypsin-like peptidase domain-containing protein [Planctomycetota bacterium]
MNGRIGIKHLDGSSLAGLEQDYSGPEVTIGTSAAAHICFDPDDDPGVEAKHASLSLRPDGVWLEPKTSAALLVNGAAVDGPKLLQDGDTVQLAPSGPQFVVSVHELPSSDAPASTVMGGRRGPRKAPLASPPSPASPPSASPPAPTNAPTGEAPTSLPPKPRYPGLADVAPTVVGKRAGPGTPGQPPPVRLDMGGGMQTTPNAPPPPPPAKKKRGKKGDGFGMPQPSSRPPGAGLGMNTVMGMIDRATKKERGRTTLRMAALFVVLICLGGVSAGAAYFFWPEPASPGSGGTTVIETVEDWKPAVTKQVSQSVCLVIERTPDEAHTARSYGTAWSVDTESGWLATNAHVAEPFFNEVGGQRVEMIARTPGNDPKDLRITEVLIHPGYNKWSELAEYYNPFNSEESRFFSEGTFANCDVALMRVHPDDREHMPPAIPLASEGEAAFIDVSYEAASFGYSKEGQLINTDKPSPEAKFGVINKWTDSFLGPGRRDLIYFNWAITGGASGSPVVNRDGRVVALIAANQFHFTPEGERIPSGSSLGPHVDFLRELLNETVEADQAQRTALWEQEYEALFIEGAAFSERIAQGFAYKVFSFWDNQGVLIAGRTYDIKPYSSTQVQLTVEDGKGQAVANGIRLPPDGRFVLVAVTKDRFTPIAVSFNQNARLPDDMSGYALLFGEARGRTVNLHVFAEQGTPAGTTTVGIHLIHVKAR